MVFQPTKKTFNFFQKITVNSDDFEDCVVRWDFVSAGFMLYNEGAPGTIVEYSFDGTTVHGDLNADLATVGLAFDSRHQDRVFFRLSSGSPAVVRIEAWA